MFALDVGGLYGKEVCIIVVDTPSLQMGRKKHICTAGNASLIEKKFFSIAKRKKCMIW